MFGCNTHLLHLFSSLVRHKSLHCAAHEFYVSLFIYIFNVCYFPLIYSLPFLRNRGSFVGFITTFLIDCLCFLPALGIFELSHLLAVIRLLFFKLVRGVVWDHITIVKLNSLQCLALGSLVPFKNPLA